MGLWYPNIMDASYSPTACDWNDISLEAAPEVAIEEARRGRKRVRDRLTSARRRADRRDARAEFHA